MEEKFMKLTDLDKQNAPVKALKENFAMDFNVSNMDRAKTRSMLNQVKGLINETKRSSDFHKAHNSPAYMKLVFMEQALTQHMRVAKAPRIVFENEEVDKSQVILAAQDMVDSIQKMYEDVNDMLVKELPALVDSIQSEIGVNESDQFNQQSTTSLTALNSALQETKAALQTALGSLTGQGSPDAFAADQGMADMPEVDDESMTDIDIDVDGADMADVDADVELPPIPDETEDSPTGSVGRARR